MKQTMAAKHFSLSLLTFLLSPAALYLEGETIGWTPINSVVVGRDVINA